MIVRILGEGQFDVPDGALDRLNEIDAALVAAIEADHEAAFQHSLSELHRAVHELGSAMPSDHLGPSDLALPGDGATLAEVRELLGDEGLVPG